MEYISAYYNLIWYNMVKFKHTLHLMRPNLSPIFFNFDLETPTILLLADPDYLLLTLSNCKFWVERDWILDSLLIEEFGEKHDSIQYRVECGTEHEQGNIVKYSTASKVQYSIVE